MLSDSQSIKCSVSAEAGVAAEITATQSVCIEQSLNPTRVLRKLNAKRSFATTHAAERKDQGAGALSCNRKDVLLMSDWPFNNRKC